MRGGGGGGLGSGWGVRVDVNEGGGDRFGGCQGGCERRIEVLGKIHTKNFRRGGGGGSGWWGGSGWM